MKANWLAIILGLAGLVVGAQGQRHFSKNTLKQLSYEKEEYKAGFEKELVYQGVALCTAHDIPYPFPSNDAYTTGTHRQEILTQLLNDLSDIEDIGVSIYRGRVEIALQWDKEGIPPLTPRSLPAR